MRGTIDTISNECDRGRFDACHIGSSLQEGRLRSNTDIQKKTSMFEIRHLKFLVKDEKNKMRWEQVDRK